MAGRNYIVELRKTLLLAAPITAGHVSQMLLGVADTVMIGRVGVVQLAASALAHTLVHFVFITGIGLLSSVSVLVSHAYGAGKKEEAGEMLRRGLAIGIASGLMMFAGLWGGMPLMDYLGQPVDVVIACKPYLWLLASTLPLMMAIICLRNYSEAQDAPWPAFWVGLGTVLLNIFLNWVLIYGNLGAPALGLIGAGIATVLARVVNVVALFWWLRLDRRFADSWPVRWFTAIPWSGIMSMLRLGFPVGLQLLMEIGAFSGTTLLMGWLGVVEMASHQIALTCGATTFMVPLGISLAVAIRVGHVIGAGQPERARPVAFSSLGFGFLCSLAFAAVFLLFSRQLAGFFTRDPATLSMAATLIIVAGFFQVFDAGQAIAAGALRGCKDVRIPTWIIFAAYWVVAIPLGATLAFGFDAGATGLWIGLAAGLAVAAFGLVGRFGQITGRMLG
jgi:MATE family multidrug resistance protein